MVYMTWSVTVLSISNTWYGPINNLFQTSNTKTRIMNVLTKDCFPASRLARDKEDEELVVEEDEDIIEEEEEDVRKI